MIRLVAKQRFLKPQTSSLAPTGIALFTGEEIIQEAPS